MNHLQFQCKVSIIPNRVSRLIFIFIGSVRSCLTIKYQASNSSSSSQLGGKNSPCICNSWRKKIKQTEQLNATLISRTTWVLLKSQDVLVVIIVTIVIMNNLIVRLFLILILIIIIIILLPGWSQFRLEP